MNKNKYLLIAFVLLLFFLFWKQFMASDNSRNFKEILVKLDTATVTKISVISKNNEFDTIIFTKSSDKWEVSNGVIDDDANQSTVKGMLSAVANMKPQRLVAKGKDKWNQYEVSDSTGTKAQFFDGTDLIANLVVGKFNFQQNTRAMSTFVRLSDDSETYAVEGMLSSSFSQNFNDFRDKTFLNTDKNNLTSLRFDYQGDSSFVLTKIDEKWQVHGNVADSIAVDDYLNGIRNLTQRDFADNFSKNGKIADYHLTIDGNNMSAIDIYGYANEEELILNSSQNDNAHFKSGSLDVFDKLFVPSYKFEVKQK